MKTNKRNKTNRTRKSALLWIGLAAVLLLAGCGGGNSVDDLLEAGNEAFAERNYAEARGFYLQGLEIDNQNRDLLIACSKAYKQDYMLDSAIYYLKRGDLLHRDDREINELIREIAKTLGDWPNAISAVEALARLDGSKEPYHVELAELLIKNNEPGRAYYHGRLALLAGPNVPGLYIQTASLAAEYDSVEVAIEVLDSAITKFGPQDQFVVNQAMMLATTGDLRRAEAGLRLVIDRSSSPRPGLKMNLAAILAAQPERAKKEAALRIYEEIRSAIPGQHPVDSLLQALRNELQ